MKRFWQILQVIVFALWAVFAALYLALALYVTRADEIIVGNMPAVLVVLLGAVIGIGGLKLMQWLDTKIDGKNSEPVRWTRNR